MTLNSSLLKTELDALLLENNLIKKHQPRYNIQWRDDKTYPFICIKNERFPRIFSTRTIIDDGSAYFGPYASVKRMHVLLDLIKKLYSLRSCNFVLSEKNIEQGKFKVCLEYHIKNCQGACEALETEEHYLESIAQATQIIKGHTAPVIRNLKKEMAEMAEVLDFENANKIKEKIYLLEKLSK